MPAAPVTAKKAGRNPAARLAIGFAMCSLAYFSIVGAILGIARDEPTRGLPVTLWLLTVAYVGIASAALYWLLREPKADLVLIDASQGGSAEARQRTDAMFELANMGITEVALDGHFLRVNPAFCAITGYSEAELLGMSGQDLTPAQDRSLSLDLMANAIKGLGDRFTIEKRYVRKDGSLVWIELSTTLARDTAGTPSHFVTITEDISQRRATEDALRASEARYRSVIDHMSAGLVQHTADGRIVAFNRAAPAVLDLSEDQILARAPMDPAWQTLREDGSPMPADEHPSSRVLRTGRPVINEIVGLRRSDGTSAWLQVSASVFPGAAHEPHGAVVTFTDVTAERNALAALRESESLYRSVIETMDEAVLLIDADGRTIGSNPAATRVFGIDESRVREAGPYTPKLRLYQADGTELATAQRPSYRALKLGERVTGAIYRATRPDDTEIWVEINARRVVLASGLAPGALVTLTDVTARVEAEVALRALTSTLERRVAERTAELSQLNRELESFAYSVSHDLRAPLRAIAGFTVLLREDEAGRLSQDGAGLLERIAANARRMGELIDDVLEYSRITRIDRKREDIDVGALVKEVLAPLRQAYPDTTCRVLPLGRVNADMAMLRQILQNLLDNAFKYSSHTADASVVIDTVEEEGAKWFRVRDNGVGFDMRYADRLFGMFQRMHTVAEFGGTGVGLAIVKRLVERHGGRVEASAKPGEGASFRFHLDGETASPAT
jgi:PAS domain S-box-containing protein